MAEERLRDAKALLDGQRWEFAYYSAGYAVECALKSCVLASSKRCCRYGQRATRRAFCG